MSGRYDNLAYRYEYSAEPLHTPYQNPNLRIKSTTKKSTKPQPKNRYASFLRLAIVALFAFLVLARGVALTDKANRLNEMKKELAQLQAQNQKTQMDIEKALDLNRIEQIASQKLNMRRPEKYQIVYINLDRVDYVEKAEGTASPINKAGRLFSDIKSYLD